MLTSGTTGPPKRVDLTYDTLERVLRRGQALRVQPDDERSACARASPSSTRRWCTSAACSGCCSASTTAASFCAASSGSRSTAGSTPCAATGRAPSSLVPAALRMVLEADLDPADLAQPASRSSRGTAPARPRRRRRVHRALRRARAHLLRRHRVRRRRRRAGTSTTTGALGRRSGGASAGRTPAASCASSTRAPARPWPTRRGCSRCRPASSATAGWVRTTDLARIDDDGFLWILGRADQAIIRGGFKVLPEAVRAALVRHPAVGDAVVLGATTAASAPFPSRSWSRAWARRSPRSRSSSSTRASTSRRPVRGPRDDRVGRCAGVYAVAEGRPRRDPPVVRHPLNGPRRPSVSGARGESTRRVDVSLGDVVSAPVAVGLVLHRDGLARDEPSAGSRRAARPCSAVSGPTGCCPT